MSYRMPAEWEQHHATWLAWPHEESDWVDSFPRIKDVYRNIVAALSPHERLEILCANEKVRDEAEGVLSGLENYSLHLVPNDRSWVRDSGPTSVITSEGKVGWIRWQFNAWARYDNYSQDSNVAGEIIDLSGLEALEGLSGNGDLLVLEGGAIDSDGEGTLLLTEECLLSSVQSRNPLVSKNDYEAIFKKFLGIQKCIWLGKGVAGDDTHGHIDGVCRFVAPARVFLCAPRPGDSEFEAVYRDNVVRIRQDKDAGGREIEIVDLPLPRKLYHEEQLLPASYANFYLANNSVLVPTFQDPNDRIALDLFESAFPDRSVVGIDCRDLIVGMGAIHCITQPQFSELVPFSKVKS